MACLTLQTPADFDLARDVCSYGYFRLAPNRWNRTNRVLERVLSIHGAVYPVSIAQGSKGLVIKSPRALRPVRRELVGQITRMLRLDMSEATVREFHAVDPRWRRSGRARLFRSPTLYEDVIKTVTSCNVTWTATVNMNRRLCEVCGSCFGEYQAFPAPGQLAGRRPAFLRSRCGLGYRDARVVELSRLWKGGRFDWLENPAVEDDQVHSALIELPGIGPYAAANIMQLLGRFGRLPLDTESVRHGKTVLGFRGTSAQVARKVRAHFAPFGAWAFLSYWLEIWAHYERTQGAAWDWE